MLTIKKVSNFDSTGYTTEEDQLIIDPASGSISFADTTGVTTLGSGANDDTTDSSTYVFAESGEYTCDALDNIFFSYSTIVIKPNVSITATGSYGVSIPSTCHMYGGGKLIVSDENFGTDQHIHVNGIVNNITLEAYILHAEKGSTLTNCVIKTTDLEVREGRLVGCVHADAQASAVVYECSSLLNCTLAAVNLNSFGIEGSGPSTVIYGCTADSIEVYSHNTAWICNNIIKNSIINSCPTVYVLNNVVDGELEAVTYTSM